MLKNIYIVVYGSSKEHSVLAALNSTDAQKMLHSYSSAGAMNRIPATSLHRRICFSFILGGS